MHRFPQGDERHGARSVAFIGGGGYTEMQKDLPFEVRGGKNFDPAAASLKFTGIDREWQVKKDFG